MRGIDAEYDYLEQQLADGFITVKEYNRELRDLESSYRYEAEESAHGAYQDELDRWY